MQIEERHRKAAQKSIQYLHQVTGFLKGESQHLRKLWVESVAQLIADCEASSDPLAFEKSSRYEIAKVNDIRWFLRVSQASDTDYVLAALNSYADPLAVAARMEESIRRAFEKVYGPEPQGVHYSVPSVLSPDDLWVTRWLTWQASWQAALEEMRKLLDMEGKL